MANFRNRKGRTSINVMAVCGPDCTFDFVCAKFPGSCHDSFIEKNSEFHQQYEVRRNFPMRNLLVLGDSAYSRYYSWCCTPFLEGTLGGDIHKIRFNKCICTCRSPIEQIFGQVKKVFPVLKYGIRFSLRYT